ncbi:MAG: hypothetical protein H0T73_12995 [Ardenticatenales bacterium]|nr:hypothetical protein [Ardenticatenales bacterium]
MSDKYACFSAICTMGRPWYYTLEERPTCDLFTWEEVVQGGSIYQSQEGFSPDASQRSNIRPTEAWVEDVKRKGLAMGYGDRFTVEEGRAGEVPA